MGNLVPTTITDKNGKVTTVHKKTDVAPSSGRLAGAPSPARTEVAPRANSESLTSEIVDEFVESGLLSPARSLNGGKRYETGSILVGWNAEGSRVFVSLAMEWREKDARSIDLEEVKGGYWSFSMSGETYMKGKRDSDTAGQISDELDGIGGAGDAISAEDASAMKAIWDDLHLNDLNGGTRKQTAKAKELREQGIGPDMTHKNQVSWSEYKDMIGEDRGYSYGSAWLVKPVPSDKVEQALLILEKAKG